MANRGNIWIDEDDCCAGCGVRDYAPSKTAGLCVDCNPCDSRGEQGTLFDYALGERTT